MKTLCFFKTRRFSPLPATARIAIFFMPVRISALATHLEGKNKLTFCYIFNTKTHGFEMSVSKTHHEIIHFVRKVMKTQ